MSKHAGSAVVSGYRVSWAWAAGSAEPMWHVAGTRPGQTTPYAIGYVKPDGKAGVWSHGRRFTHEESKVLVEKVHDTLVAQGLVKASAPKKPRAAAGSGPRARSRAAAAPRASAQRYRARFVHKISPKPNDYGNDAHLSRADLKSAPALAAVLRATRNLLPGQRLRSYRVERDGRVVAFPATGIWHSILLEPV